MTTFNLSGIINHQTSTETRGQLLAALRHEDALHIDLSEVTWIDSSGLAIPSRCTVNIRGNSYRMRDHQNLLQAGSDQRRKRGAS